MSTKITDVEIRMVNRFLHVLITTDEGHTGVGESGAWGFLDASAEAVRSFREYLIGKDPTLIEHHWQYMYRSFHFRGAAIMGAISAIDIALWDITGKIHDCPVYRLLGGGARRKVRTYYHVSGSTTEELVEDCVRAKELGYTAVGHLSPFLDESREKPYFQPYAQTLTSAADRVRRIREAVGNDVDLCLELHRRLAPGEAIAFAAEVEPYHPFFIEDPTTPDNFDSMAHIAEHVRVPVATGERLHTVQEFAMLLSRRAMDYARVSVCVAGGITGARKIAAVAEAYGVPIVPHNPLSPVSTAACLQVALAVENCALMELPDHTAAAATERYTSTDNATVTPLDQSAIAAPVPAAVDGFVPATTAPGIGIELVEGAAARFPYRRREINTRLHRDGSVVDQ